MGFHYERSLNDCNPNERSGEWGLAKNPTVSSSGSPRYGNPGEMEHIGVEPMLLALAMELALKAWFVFDFDDPHAAKSHDLLKLFDSLKPDTRTNLEAQYKASVAPYNPNVLFINGGIRHILPQHKDVFVDWRYLHEGKKSMMFDQGPFEATLEMVLQELKKRYRIERAKPLWQL